VSASSTNYEVFHYIIFTGILHLLLYTPFPVSLMHVLPKFNNHGEQQVWFCIVHFNFNFDTREQAGKTKHSEPHCTELSSNLTGIIFFTIEVLIH
jgi:hypothetical protein